MVQKVTLYRQNVNREKEEEEEEDEEEKQAEKTANLQSQTHDSRRQNQRELQTPQGNVFTRPKYRFFLSHFICISHHQI